MTVETYELLYHGVDTLDVAFQGSAPRIILEDLEVLKSEAEKDLSGKYGAIAAFGCTGRQFSVKSHGMQGGYRYTLVDQNTGTIVSIKNDTAPENWGVFVSCRAHSLLTLGYSRMKAELSAILQALGIEVRGVSVNRIDYAFDFLAPEFDLRMENFIVPAQAKVSPFYSTNQTLDDFGDKQPGDGIPVSSVMRGGRFETVTIGMMPGRQVTVYDKSRASKAQHKHYWFDAWQIDPKDPLSRVFRVEFRAGRDALTRLVGRLGHRTYETIEALHPKFLKVAVQQVRYVPTRNESNVTRSDLHPLWCLVKSTIGQDFSEREPPLTPDYLREFIRKQRADMARAQGFGNLNNALILEGLDTDTIARDFPSLVADRARQYRSDIGEVRHGKKLEASKARNSPLLSKL